MSPSIHVPAGELIQYVQGELTSASVNAKHSWKLPVLITASEGRIVVLRKVDPLRGSWQFFTDRRTPKVSQLVKATGSAAATFYNPEDRTQLRLTGSAIELELDKRRELWEMLSCAQKSSYAAAQPPGTVLNTGGDGLSINWSNGIPTKDEELAAFENFLVFDFEIAEFELLLLHREGSRRCKWNGWNGEDFKWLVP